MRTQIFFATLGLLLALTFAPAAQARRVLAPDLRTWIPLEASACRAFAHIGGRYEYYVWGQSAGDQAGVVAGGMSHAVEVLELRAIPHNDQAWAIVETPLSTKPAGGRTFAHRTLTLWDNAGACRFVYDLQTDATGGATGPQWVNDTYGVDAQGTIHLALHFGRAGELRPIQD